MRISLILFIIFAGLAFSEILFSDDFNDGIADGWSELAGAEFAVIDGEYCCWGDASSIGLSSAGDVAGIMSVPDYSFRAKVEMEAGLMIGQFVRFSYYAEYMYCLCIGEEAGGIALVKADQNNQYVLDSYSMAFEYNQPYWMRFEIQDDILGGKVWTGTIEDEPSEWMVLATDNSVSAPGSIALFCLAPEGDEKISMFVTFDDVQVTDNLTLALHAVTWASIKSSF
ncbi:MAG: hypothetical protein K8S62_03310 [Candidatus Sabulitectum sp.]|nr:hypothetical protein [Candidatus Sabulitectum sp.]